MASTPYSIVEPFADRVDNYDIMTDSVQCRIDFSDKISGVVLDFRIGKVYICFWKKISW